MSSTIVVHSPVLRTPPAAPVTLAPRLDDLAGATLGLVDNGKPRARELLLRLGEALTTTAGIVRTELVSKPSAANALAEADADGLAAAVDVAIAGLGDCGACSASSLHDAIMLEDRGVPATVVITDVFLAHVARFADALGAPGYHSLVVPHPVAPKDDAAVAELARSIATAAATQLVAPSTQPALA